MTAKKRGQNEGSAYQRADGRWEALLTIPAGSPGGPKRKSFYGKTKAEAMKKMRDGQRTLDQGLSVIPDKQTVGEFLDKWLVEVAQPTIRPRTFQSYEQLIRVHLKPGLGAHKLKMLTPDHVQAFMRAKTVEGLSPRTVQYLRAVLRRALGHALKWELVSRNVATLVDPPRSVRHEIQPFSEAQARTFLEAVKGDRLEALYWIAIRLGVRQGEALGLTWSAVNLDAGTLAVVATLQRIDGEPCFAEPKTDRSRRTLPLPSDVVSILRAHRIRQLEERLAMGGAWDGWGDLVFTTAKGKPLEASTTTKLFQKTLERHGLPRIRFHDLRHSCASIMLARGVGARTIMEQLGHSQISLTMDLYSHVAPEMLQDAAERMQRAFANG